MNVKIYVVCDLEGTAGVADQIHQCSFEHESYDDRHRPGEFGPFYLQARRLATLELNALVEGALAGGATEIWAWDGHCRFPAGLDVELLHPACRLVMNAGDGGPVGLDGSCAALFLLGLHAKQGTPAAPQAHGIFPGKTWNGEDVGEIGMTIATAAVHGVRVTFISGDRAAVREAQAFVPQIETVVTKEPLFTHVASVTEVVPVLSLAPARSRELIRAGATRALQRLGEIPAPPRPPFDPSAA
ncbi:MAG: M55 family metallopeptidase [Candidatus Riflebacteria bacterium]|nr:M55 family metallopeptidase [Candidatus Riflebacteria bacterium]